MNPYRKVKNFHITYKGHYMISIPYEFEWLAYCYEEEAMKHTHVVLQTVDKISKLDLIRELSQYLEIPCQIDVSIHKNIETILGYHIGMGDKRRCNDLVIIKPEIEVDDYIRKKIMHKPRGIIQNAARNFYLLNTDTKTLIDNGDIPLEKLILINNCKDLYGKLKVDERDELEDPIGNPWGLAMPNDRDNKKCHFWIWSRESNRGKSTFAKELVSKFRGILKTGGFEWWNIRKDCDFICLDEYTGGLKYNQLNSLCDGSYEDK